MHIQDWIDLCKVQMKEIADEYNRKNEGDFHFESELAVLHEKWNILDDACISMEEYRDSRFNVRNAPMQQWIDSCHERLDVQETELRIALDSGDENSIQDKLTALAILENAIAELEIAYYGYDFDLEERTERVPAEEEALINQCINESLGTKEILLRFPVDMFDEMQKLSIEVGVSLPFFIRTRLQEALFDHKSGLTVIT